MPARGNASHGIGGHAPACRQSGAHPTCCDVRRIRRRHVLDFRLKCIHDTNSHLYEILIGPTARAAGVNHCVDVETPGKVNETLVQRTYRFSVKFQADNRCYLGSQVFTHPQEYASPHCLDKNVGRLRCTRRHDKAAVAEEARRATGVTAAAANRSTAGFVPCSIVFLRSPHSTR